MAEGTLPANERSVRTGGLMRCCLATLDESTMPSTVGTVLSCKYESDPDNDQMVVAPDGVWEWNRPRFGNEEITVIPDRVFTNEPTLEPEDP